MATATTSNLGTLIEYLKRKYSLDRLDMSSSIDSDTTNIIVVIDGKMVLIELRGCGPQDIDEAVGRAAEQIIRDSPNILDLRWNAIENITDIQAFITRADLEDRNVSTFLMTDEQLANLADDPLLRSIVTSREGQLVELYGRKVKLMRQPPE